MSVAETAIVDYGMANLRSVQKAFEKVGQRAIITSDPNQVAEAAKVVLPGVGAFRDGIGRLRQSGLDEPIIAHIDAGKPFLGICLGLQLLFSKSFEDGEHSGLGVLAGEVVRLPDGPGLKVPHMGWNELHIRKQTPLVEGLPERPYAYFVHSYYVVPTDRDVVAAETDHSILFASMIWRDRLFGAQFHPEKSQQVGLQMLKRFAEL
jgi:glutamine amidotransferase